MSDQYDNTNSGLMFPADSMQVIRQGKIDIEGFDHNLILVQCKTAKGKTVYEIHKQVGVVFEADADKNFDSQGTIDVGDGEYTVWLRKKTSKNKTPMTAVGLARPLKKDEPNNGLSQHSGDTTNTTVIDDDIPF